MSYRGEVLVAIVNTQGGFRVGDGAALVSRACEQPGKVAYRLLAAEMVGAVSDEGN